MKDTMIDKFIKIDSCIESSTTKEQLESCNTMVDLLEPTVIESMFKAFFYQKIKSKQANL